jgi:anthranilate phosphoribosyltransferase
MTFVRDTLEQLLERRGLGETQAGELLLALTDASLAPAMAGAVLAALRSKGITADELRGFAKTMRSLARHPHLSPGSPFIDMVGTGGDGSGSFNLSTGASLVAAAAGLRVVKHGNRSISSRSGSADLLEALGLKLPLDETAAGACLDATGFTFLFAPYYHPSMKALAPVRQALGVRTVFNILGPLTNPAAPPYHVIGAYSLEVAQLMAETLAGLPIRRAYVVHGARGWDEATPIGPFELFDVLPGEIVRTRRSAEEFGLEPCQAEDLHGGDAAYNAAQLTAVLSGEQRGAHRDCLVLGAALMLELMDKAQSPRAAAAMAEAAIDGGQAKQVLAKLGTFAQ